MSEAMYIYVSLFLFLKFKQLFGTIKYDLPVKNVLRNQFYILFRTFVLFFLVDRKSLDLKTLEHLKVVIFYLFKK